MSMIDKLQILGVRSFDNKKAEIIKFYSPLTLIVGFNGSGKTTIIECLRYATTGELPPNSTMGGAWIHDPKLAGENEVLAQVKLSFNSATGARMVLNRNLQLTVKKNTRSQKALDATLLMMRNGERTTISSRVAELDRIMPEHLGVSKAILESVIFCHQDESLWPMSTPAILKKKFDEIFEALKYTKAVENIKLIRKTHAEKLKVFEVEEGHAKSNKDKGAKAEARSEQLYKEIEELREQQEELRKKIKAANDRATSAYDQAAQFEKIVVELAGKRIEAQAATRTINSLKQNMREMSDSDQALRDMLEQYEDRLTHNERDKEAFTKNYRDLAQTLQQNRNALGEKQSELGLLQGQKQRYDEQVTNRKELIKDTARRHNIRGFDVDITDEHIREFMEKISRMAREQQNAFERARKETYEETQRAQQELTNLNSRKSELTQTKSGANSYIQSNDSKILRYQAELDKIEVDEGGKSVLESNLNDLESRLSRSKQEFDNSGFEGKIQSTESNLRSLDAEKEKYDSEMLEASRNAKESARLDLLHKDLKDRRQGLQTVSGAHGDKISAILGSSWEPSSLEEVYQNVLSEKTSAIKEAELQRDGTIREVEHVKYKLTSTKESLRRKEKEITSHERTVSDSIEKEGFGPTEFPDYLAQLEAELVQATADQSSYEAMKDYYQQCKETLQSTGKCRLCQRRFEEEAAKATFLRQLEKFLSLAIKNTKGDFLQDAEELLSKAKEARPHYETWVALEAEIPVLKAEVESLESRIESLDRHLEQQDQVVREREESKRDVEFYSKTIQSITKYHHEIVSIESQITQLAAARNTAGTFRGLEKIQDDQKAVTERIRNATSSLQQLRIGKDRAHSEITSLEFQVRDVRSQLTTAIHQLKEKESLQNQILDLKAQNSEQHNIIRRADQDIQALVPQISQVQAKLEDIRARGDERDRTLQKEAAKLTDSLNQLRIADQEINSYIDRSGPQQLARATRELSNIHDEIGRIEEEQRGITVQIKKLETELANHNETKRAISDNLTYRESIEHLQVLEQEINDLQSNNAEVDKAKYEFEGDKWQTERNRLSAEQATIIGTLKSKDDQLQQLLEEWETDYKDAAENYRKAHIQVVVTKAAIEDLGRYGGALDKAIMKYHSLKMEEINRIIDELWRNTYQGTDVDTIMIRSENETQKGNKSYNYRVVMIKQDAEMDMRGRCSAGQKVLASIIIRLALAECFGVRCGLIALDEPTTNLDRDNIRALAQALSEIIRVRRQQSNFQLIVITHDEEFLRYMNCADYADYYYRVSRDANQCSQIFKQSIQNVSAYKTENEWKGTKFEF
jgi:DNA repair protein RAD50